MGVAGASSQRREGKIENKPSAVTEWAEGLQDRIPRFGFASLMKLERAGSPSSALLSNFRRRPQTLPKPEGSLSWS